MFEWSQINPSGLIYEMRLYQTSLNNIAFWPRRRENKNQTSIFRVQQVSVKRMRISFLAAFSTRVMCTKPFFAARIVFEINDGTECAWGATQMYNTGPPHTLWHNKVLTQWVDPNWRRRRRRWGWQRKDNKNPFSAVPFRSGSCTENVFTDATST